MGGRHRYWRARSDNQDEATLIEVSVVYEVGNEKSVINEKMSEYWM